MGGHTGLAGHTAWGLCRWPSSAAAFIVSNATFREMSLQQMFWGEANEGSALLRLGTAASGIHSPIHDPTEAGGCNPPCLSLFQTYHPFLSFLPNQPT